MWSCLLEQHSCLTLTPPPEETAPLQEEMMMHLAACTGLPNILELLLYERENYNLTPTITSK